DERSEERHRRRKNCACSACRIDRAAGCAAPYKCQEQALKLLDCMHPKWDPRRSVRQINPELTDEELEQNLHALEKGEPLLFDSNITLKADISKAFRVF
ncbi:hypothetical protein B0H14DRAFT_2219839, partial [Mycena olivaceomarginata]